MGRIVDVLDSDIAGPMAYTAFIAGQSGYPAHRLGTAPKWRPGIVQRREPRAGDRLMLFVEETPRTLRAWRIAALVASEFGVHQRTLTREFRRAVVSIRPRREGERIRPRVRAGDPTPGGNESKATHTDIERIQAEQERQAVPSVTITKEDLARLIGFSCRAVLGGEREGHRSSRFVRMGTSTTLATSPRRCHPVVCSKSPDRPRLWSRTNLLLVFGRRQDPGFRAPPGPCRGRIRC